MSPVGNNMAETIGEAVDFGNCVEGRLLCRCGCDAAGSGGGLNPATDIFGLLCLSGRGGGFDDNSPNGKGDLLEEWESRNRELLVDQGGDVIVIILAVGVVGYGRPVAMASYHHRVSWRSTHQMTCLYGYSGSRYRWHPVAHSGSPLVMPVWRMVAVAVTPPSPPPLLLPPPPLAAEAGGETFVEDD